jgi:hypothetical protein
MFVQLGIVQYTMPVNNCEFQEDTVVETTIY